MRPALHIVGDNATRIWGMTGRERIARMARAEGLALADAPSNAAVLASAAFAFDPAWLRHVAAHPDSVVTLGGEAMLAHVVDPTRRAAVTATMAARAAAGIDGLDAIAIESGRRLTNQALRKREAPFARPLTPATTRAAERASYAGSYKGVTDLLTKYLWPEWAFALTRLAARIGMTPNMVTAIGAALCVAATILFWRGDYWPGMALALIFMVLDTVDGKLARCTLTASRWGNIFDHGVDLIHPPFWWWAWGMGLARYGTPLSEGVLWTSLTAILFAYVAQRLIEGAFIAGFAIHIHVWRPVDSRFRLVTARRNPNWLVLLVALALGRPDWGLVALAVWGVASLVFHLVRLAQAYARRARGLPVTSWLADP